MVWLWCIWVGIGSAPASRLLALCQGPSYLNDNSTDDAIPRVAKSYNTSHQTTNHHINHNRPLNNMMDVTFVLEESGVTATVEVPCEADVAAAKEVACTALAVSPASVEMRIGTQVLEGTCRLQDTAFGAGVQVVLARRFADIKCPAEYSVEAPAEYREDIEYLSLSRCGTLCVFWKRFGRVGGFDTETFDTVFSFKVDDTIASGAPAISQCKTLYYVPCRNYFCKVALPGGEVLRKIDVTSNAVSACGGVVVSQGDDGVSVYDEDLTLLRTISHEECFDVEVSDCGGWVITSSWKNNVRLWDVSTGESVACVQFGGCALSRCASVFAVRDECSVHLYDWMGAALRSVDVAVGREVKGMQFTPCGKYLVVRVGVALYTRTYDADGSCSAQYYGFDGRLHQYDVATMSCVRVIPQTYVQSFAISPCSRVVVFECEDKSDTPAVIVTRHLYPHNSE